MHIKGPRELRDISDLEGYLRINEDIGVLEGYKEIRVIKRVQKGYILLIP